MVSIPDAIRDLLTRPVPCVLVTLMPDGQPQGTPVWFTYDGQYFLVNTARGRQKDRNMTYRAKVALVLLDPDNPFRYAEVRGHVVESTQEGALAHADEMMQKYTGESKSRFVFPGETRVVYKIEVDKVYFSVWPKPYDYHDFKDR